MFSRLYAAVTNARNALYERGVFKSYALGVPVISVGNITVGGTGKTPLVVLVAETFAAKGEKVCILTRGYGRENPRNRVVVSDGEKVYADSKQAGDEPFELACKLLGKASVIADANRVAAGIWAREQFGITTFVLDDGFQHRKVRRDLNIVCVDATNPFGNGKTLPSGSLREPLENLERADAIVVTRANLTKNLSNLKAEISKYNVDCPLFAAKNKVSELIDLKDFHEQSCKYENRNRIETHKIKSQSLNNKERFLAFCALGNPNNFFEQLRQENYHLVSTEVFPDHYFYKQTDARALSEKAKKSGAGVLLTTAKDAVKLKDFNFEMPCRVVESRMVFDGGDDFENFILRVQTKK